MAGRFIQLGLRATCWSGVVSLVASLPLAGCALPDYHLPGGFSSTYYRALQQSEYERTAATVAQVSVSTAPAPAYASSAAPAGVAIPAQAPQSGISGGLAGSPATPPAVSSGWREWVRGMRPGRSAAGANTASNGPLEQDSAMSAPSAGQPNSGLLGSSTRVAP